MFCRRKLPHWLPDVRERAFLSITWRLAGSLPRAAHAGFSAGAVGQALSPGKAFLAFQCEADKAAFGPVWLRDPRIATIVAETLQYGETGRNYYDLRAWVMVPNHVHLLLLPKQLLPVITRWLKGSTARSANLMLGRTGETFWQDESLNHIVRDEAELEWLIRICRA